MLVIALIVVSEILISGRMMYLFGGFVDHMRARVQISENDSGYATIPDVTDWEFRIENRLKPNFVFDDSGSKQLTSLEEMERIVSARITMNLTSDAYLSYLLDQTEAYLKLVLTDSRWMKLNKGKFRLVEPVLKPEDLIACRVEFEGRWLTHGF